ncbi:hypothetical protein ACFLZB_04560 [Nanoarchaeota archaeon]
MDFRVKSIITVTMVVVIMLMTGFLVNYFQGGITGAVVSGTACYNDADCDDSIECTVDSCVNPGTELSFCSNQIFCQNNDGCCSTGCTEANDNDCLIITAKS